MKSRRAQIKLFAKPLLHKYPDLTMKGIGIFLVPIRHVYRVITIDRSSGTGRSISWGADYLFHPSAQIGLGYGQVMNNRQLTYLDDDDAKGRFFKEAETVALPALRALETLEDFFRFVSRIDSKYQAYRFDNYSIADFPISYIPLLVGTGRFELARDECRKLPKNRFFNDKHMGPFFRMYLDELYPPLLKDDRPALAAVLHRWEEQAVRTNRLEHLWKKTPFPFECPMLS